MAPSAAFFACTTLLPPKADLTYFLEFWARGRSNEEFISAQVAIARSEAARGTDPAAVDGLLFAMLRGSTHAELRTAGQRWHRQHQRSEPVPGRSIAVLAQIARHQTRGDLVVLVSDLPEPCLHPVAANIAADAILSTELVADDVGDRLNGTALRPMVGAARADAVRRFAISRGLRLAECHAYGTAPKDLAMLRAVGRASVVGNHPVMLNEAEAAGWFVVFSRTRTLYNASA